MKAVILAAGKGTRMLPLTENIPKVLVKINGKPFLYWLIKNLLHAGFNDFCLVVGYQKEKIETFLKELKTELPNQFQSTTVEQKKQLGTGHAVLQTQEFVGDEDFMVLGGDNLWSVKDLQDMNVDDELNYISGIKVKHPEKYGVLVVDESGMLQEIKEKPTEFVGNLINTGLYKFKTGLFGILETLTPSPRGEIELTDAITTLAKQDKVKVNVVKGFWRDLGCPADVEPLSKFLKQIENHS